MAFIFDVQNLLEELQGDRHGNVRKLPRDESSNLDRSTISGTYENPYKRQAVDNGGSQHGVSRFGHYLHTPEQQTAQMTSSPEKLFLSSPSYQASQNQQRRRQNQHAPYLRAMTREHVPETPRRTHNIEDPRQINLSHAPPLVQGIQLVSPHQLPDKFRSIFPYPTFNAVQSKCFSTIYDTDENFVLSAPTGSGKTGVLELAICRLVMTNRSDSYKIVYMAPTKSLCAERQRDWQAKFQPLSIKCAELTGDTDHMHLRQVQTAGLIITTPEKWDSITRKWKDHVRLMQMIKLLLIDEVHMLKEARGATLEAVVSRMKSIGTNVRFIALSATVPNAEDIAAWLGLHPGRQDRSAHVARFGEEFRPVRLQKYVCGIPYRGNDFGFEKPSDKKLPELVARYSNKKPIMVFCFTRKSCVSTAKLLASVWTAKAARDRPWPGPTQRVMVQEPELKGLVASGVAFHHAGVDATDRHIVEKAYLEGQIHVICCTSTLAVGVNLPCHMVIIKGTVCYQDDGIKEYSDLEMMQMLGRAGRPQFDDSAVAVIITREEKKNRYEKLVSGQDVLESCLHLNLIEHLNAEIGLGTILDIHSAQKWLSGTFLATRLRKNPGHYKLRSNPSSEDLHATIEQICHRDISLLLEHDLIADERENGKLRCTDFGEAMSRYYVKFETMKVFLGLEPRAKISDILSVIAHAEEYHEVRIRATEKKLWREINNANGIKYPIKVDLALHTHKRSLIIQAELGGVDFPIDDQFGKHKRQYLIDKTIVLSHVHRLIRCIIDCQVSVKDAIAVRHALGLARSLGAGVWDNSPLQMKQIPNIGPVAVRKLAVAGINSLEALEAAEPYRIEHLLAKNPPFGSNVLSKLDEFPKFRISLKVLSKIVKPKEGIKVKIRVDCGFINQHLPLTFNKKPVYACILLERSDGVLVEFRRLSAKELSLQPDFISRVDLTNNLQTITAHIMSDNLAGTARSALLEMEAQSGMPKSSLKDSNDGVSEEVATQMEFYGHREAHEEEDDYEELEGNIKDSDLVKAAEAQEKQVKAQKAKDAAKELKALQDKWFLEEYSPYGRVEKGWGAAEKTGDGAKKA